MRVTTLPKYTSQQHRLCSARRRDNPRFTAARHPFGKAWQSSAASNFTEGYKKGQEESNSPKAVFPDGYQRDSPKFLFR